MNSWFPEHAPWRDQADSLNLDSIESNGNSGNMSTLTTIALAGVTAAAVNGVVGWHKRKSKSSDTETITEGGFLGFGATTRTVETKTDDGPSTMMLTMGALALL